ncbi:hypothetical protein QJQ45_011686 [Haematococcus lacustris]|nr:hypothetical protein QJQ45_011686 [Haematococcus lacustris]
MQASQPLTATFIAAAARALAVASEATATQAVAGHGDLLAARAANAVGPAPLLSGPTDFTTAQQWQWQLARQQPGRDQRSVGGSAFTSRYCGQQLAAQQQQRQREKALAHRATCLRHNAAHMLSTVADIALGPLNSAALCSSTTVARTSVRWDSGLDSSVFTAVVYGSLWLRPVYSSAKRSRVRGLMCSTSNNIRFCDRDVSAALNIRCAVGPGPRTTELCYWEGRPAMPKPGQPGQEWVYLRDKALLRKWRRKWRQ